MREASDVMIINDGTLEELKEKIKNLVTLIKIDDYD
jgi:dephospho-CoA kinase